MRKPLAASIAFLAIGTLVSCAQSGPTQANADDQECSGQTLKVARSSSASLIYAVDYVAESQGFFKEENLEVEPMALGGGSEALQALIGGSVDVTSTAFFSMLEAKEKGAPVVAFASQGNRNTSEIGIKSEFAPPSGSEPERVIESLRGLRVGVTSPGSSTDQTLRYLLKENGMDPEKDVEITSMGSASSIVAGYSQGSIDAFLVGPPNSGIAIQEGGGEIALNIAGGEVDSLDDMLYMVASTSEKTLSEKGPLLQCYANAMDKAANFVNENPDEARDSIRANFEGISEEAFDQAWESVVGSIPDTAAILPAEAEKAFHFVEVVRGSGSIPELDTLITDQFNEGMNQ